MRKFIGNKLAKVLKKKEVIKGRGFANIREITTNKNKYAK